MQVLKQVPWEEEAVEHETLELFIGKFVRDCKVFQSKECQDTVHIVFELSPKCAKPSEGRQAEDLSSAFVLLRAFGDPVGLSGHYIAHTFLSDAENGNALETFPSNEKVASVCRVRREEPNRKWSCCGYIVDDGCVVNGIKFSFERSGETSNTNQVYHSVVLHCWSQCKPIPFCGDPMTPHYNIVHIQTESNQQALRNVMKNGRDDNAQSSLPFSIQNGEEVSFLPVDFLCKIGHSFFPFDASGMVVLNDQSFKYYKSRFDLVKKNLGIGEGTKSGPIFLFRDQWASKQGQGFVSIALPGTRQLMVGLGAAPALNWDKILNGALTRTNDGAFRNHAVILCGEYASADELLTLPDHLMASRELNGCVPGRNGSSEPPMMMCSSQYAKPFLTGLLEEVKAASPTASGQGQQALSVRYTSGHQSLFSPMASRQVQNQYSAQFKSSLQMGCKGRSLGYHLASSSESRRVFTLHGSLDDLLHDLKSSSFIERTKIDANRMAVQQGKGKELLEQNRIVRVEGEEVMSLRISNPSANAMLASAKVLGGDVPYDTKTHAIYPITYSVGGNVPLSVAGAVIIEILEVMKQLSSLDSRRRVDDSNTTTHIRLREIY